jgi:hypothetical protein
MPTNWPRRRLDVDSDDSVEADLQVRLRVA